MSGVIMGKPEVPILPAVRKTYPLKDDGLVVTMHVVGDPSITAVGVQDTDSEVIEGELPIVTVAVPTLGPLVESPEYIASTVGELFGVTSTKVMVHCEVVGLTATSLQPGGE